ncbi:MAG TPA: type II secretion system F family protein [Chthoniobacteraceae bacterium]|nr:type II secretion system F family protein [Chthoniobacteraceae bacterium]
MSVYTYEALRSNGEKVTGQLQAQSRTEAYRKLDEQNLQPVSMAAADEGARTETPAGAPEGPVRLTRSQVITFTEELSDLLDAGLQLETALRIMEERNELSVLKSVVSALRQRVRDGVNFSVALRSVSDSFGDLYCNLVAAGELSGALPQLLRRQAAYLVALGELQSRVTQALIYPAFIFGSGIVLMVVFMTVLLPELIDLLTKTGATTLPLPTQILIALSNFFAHYWWAVAGGIAFVSVTFWRFKETASGRAWWDRAKLGLPLVGPIMLARIYAQFSHTMANLLGNGVSMLTSLRLTHKAAGNVYFQVLLGKAIEMVSEGGALSQALKRVGGFPPLMIDMLVVGEQTGNADAAFEKIGTRYEKELGKRIQRLTELIQPTVIIIMAIVVGIVAYSIIVGIFQSMSALRVQHPQ